MIVQLLSKARGLFTGLGLVQYGVGGLILILVGLALWYRAEAGILKGRIERQKARVAEYQWDVSIMKGNIDRLHKEIAERNAEAEKRSRELDAKRREIAAISGENAKLRQRDEKRIEVIRSQPGESCQDGIDLIDRELGLR